MNLIRRIALALDRARARTFERETQQTLDRATRSSKATKNLGLIDRGLDRLKRAALGVGGALAAAFAARSIIRFFRQALDVAAAAEAIWGRLAGQLNAMGIAADVVMPKIRAVAESFQQTTRIGDEKFATILQELVSTSGDLAGSLRNVSVVADLAAAKQIDLKTSAQLVGRAMVGQTSTLTRYGIIVGKNQDAVEVLRETFKGMAENETKNLAGQTEQLKNAYDDLQEAIGRVFTTAADGQSTIQTLTIRIRQLTFWIDENAAAWERMGRFGRAFVNFFGSGPIGALLSLPGKFFGFGSGLRVELDNFADTTEKMQRNVDLLTASLAELARETNFGTEGSREAQDQYRNTAVALERWTTALGALHAAEKEIAGLKPRPSVATAEGEEAEFTALQKLHARNRVNREVRQMEARGSPMISSPLSPLRQDVETLNDLMPQLDQIFRDSMFGMEQAGMSVAFNVMNAWEDAFGLLFSEAAGFDEFMAAIFANTARAALQSLADVASGKVAENIAQGFEQKAKAAAAAAVGNFAGAAGHTAAAKGHFLSAAKWAAVGAIAGGAAGAIGGGGGGGGGGSGSVSGDLGRGESEKAELNIYIDPLDPEDFRLQETVAIANRLAGQTLGNNYRVSVRRRTK